MRFIIIVLGVILLVSSLLLFRDNNISPKITVRDEAPQIKVIAENLDTPWGIVFLPDDRILLTERPGRIRLIDNNGELQSQPVAVIDQVQEIGEGGLLGITIHPDFSINNYVYLYYTYSSNGGNTLNRVVRMKYENNQLKDEQIIVDGIPGASNHNGGRIKFGPDNNLYITTGDAQNPSQAQNTNSLAGKILRVTDQGEVEVYSYGHRNPQGLVWDSQGRLWATEHGPSAFDELNLIEKGKNYGWPVIQGDQTRSGMEKPQLHSGSSTWAPAGTAFYDNSIFFGGLRGQALYEANISGAQISLKEHFKNEYGRIRDVVLGPDNMIYITTSNNDGRGSPKQGDDKIIRISSFR